MTAVRELPADYREARRTVLTEQRLLLRLNLIGLVLLIAAGAAMLALAMAVAAAQPGRPAGPEIAWWLSLLLALLVLPLHEVVHGAAILAVGHRPRFGAKLDKGILYATADQALFTRNQYLLVALAPAVVLSLAGALALPLAPTGWWWTIGLAVILNASGAVGDLWAALQIVRHPASALIRDTEDGFIVYLRQPAAP